MKGALDTSEENGLTFIGLIAMMDPPRLESKDAADANVCRLESGLL